MSKFESGNKIKLNTFEDLFDETMKHQGKKGSGNPLNQVGEAAGDSAKTVQRYVYLSRLLDELFTMVDHKKIGFVQGVNISFLSIQEQEWVRDVEPPGCGLSVVFFSFRIFCEHCLGGIVNREEMCYNKLSYL